MSGSTYSYKGAVAQTFTAETTGTYDITAYGGQGGGGFSTIPGGNGAEIGGDFTLTAGEVLTIYVGGTGTGTDEGGGGGGTFVIETYDPTTSSTTSSPLVIAGGGGGAGKFNQGGPGQTGLGGGDGGGDAGGKSGMYGVGGYGAYVSGLVGIGGGGGGGGFSGSGNDSPGAGQRGGGYPTLTGGNGLGGFGGGGGPDYGGGGGGGGYTGGGGGSYGGYGAGGGGGSYDGGSNKVLVAGENSGAGFVTIEQVVCFLRGTRILTPSGEVAVETLRPGDRVTTMSGAHRALRWVGAGRTLVTPRNKDRVAPVVVRRHAIREFVPRHDLYITRGHSLYLDGVLIPVEELINHRSIAWVEDARVVEFYHLELDSHDVVLAEGVAAETYREDENAPLFLNHAYRPPLAPVPPYAPVLHDHPTVKRIWRDLSDRAGRPDLAFTADPDLHLLANGARLDAASMDSGVWRFQLAKPVTDLRIVSRNLIPSQIGLAQDQRRLGVALRRIVVEQTGLRVELDWDADGLTAGFHGPEPAERHRWTDGNAALPPRLLALLGAGATLELHVASTLAYPLPMQPERLAA